MENSVLWSKKFIPVYFIVALASFLLFNNYLQANLLSTFILIFPVLGVGIASVFYNWNREESVGK